MALAYNENMVLRFSCLGEYKIYILRHPDTKIVFYVGQTMQELKTRLVGHISDRESGTDKGDFIKEILDSGKEPIIEAIETIKVTCNVDKLYVDDKEIFWMNHYKEIGQPITNKMGMNKNGKPDYKNYLSSIKRGETSWRYYECGMLHSGEMVYNKERFIADGFEFPEEPETVLVATNKYNPFENNRFLLSINKEVDYYGHKPKKIYTEHFPEQPQWSNEFKNGLILDEFDDLLEEWDDCDLEVDMSDYEPDSDYEPEESDADESTIWDNAEDEKEKEGACYFSRMPDLS